MRPIYIIGAGSIVRDAHLPAYKKAGFCVEGVFDRDLSAAKFASDNFGIPSVYGSLQALVDDAIKTGGVFDVALPANSTAETLRVLPDGSGVLMQKPMGESLAQASEILNICKSKNLTAGVNLQLKQAPYFRQLLKLLPEIGEIYDLDWRVVTLQPWHLWTFLQEKSRCEINYHSIHYIDAVRSILGEPIGVWCRTMQSPKAPLLSQTASTIILDYPKIRANISTNHGHDFSPDYQESCLKLEGTKGAIRLTLGVILDYPAGRADKLEYISEKTGVWIEVPTNGTWFPDAFIGTMGGLLRKIENPDYNYENCVADAYKTMQVIEACYISNNNGSTPLPN